jgi:MFS family permease
MSSVARVTFGIFIQPLVAEFGWSMAATSSAYSICIFITGLLSIIVGGLTDRWGPKLVVTICGIILGLGFFLMPRVSTIWELYLVFGVLIAIGMSGCMVPMQSIVARWFIARRALMTGIVVSAAGLCQLAIAPFCSQLISSYGWRIAYMVLGGIIIIAILVFAQLLRRDPGQVSQLPDGGRDLEYEPSSKADSGVSFRETIRNVRFYMISGILFCFGFIIHTIAVHIVPHAINLGFSPLVAAGILAVIGGVSITSRVVTGFITDRIGNVPSLIIIFIFMAISLLGIQLFAELSILYLFAVIYGFSYGGSAVLPSPVTAEFFGLKAHGMILGAIIFGATIGGAIGPILIGRIFDVTNSYNVAFLICAALAVVGLILALRLKSISKANHL